MKPSQQRQKFSKARKGGLEGHTGGGMQRGSELQKAQQTASPEGLY